MIALDTVQANKEITLFIVVGNVNLWVKPEPSLSRIRKFYFLKRVIY